MKTVACFFLSLLFTGNLNAQPGCTDPLATNYNATATVNDGSCIYAASSVSPTGSYNLAGVLPESSGLICWNNALWTHNDNTDIHLYSLDTTNGNLIQQCSLTGTFNYDWEEISHDSNYIYVGDFGNNASGNRTDLHILRIEKNSVLINAPIIDTIYYSYSDQTDFTPTAANNTDFDCEAFIVTADSIYLFTKQWVSNKTSVYVLPKSPGNHVAVLKTNYDIQGLVTGAVLREGDRIIALCCYNNVLQPFIFLLYDFTGTDYFSGNKRKISVSLPFHQTEAITTSNGLKYYLTNEFFSQPPVTTAHKFHIFDLASFLGNYLAVSTDDISDSVMQQDISVYPNPAKNVITIRSAKLNVDYCLFNRLGQRIESGKLLHGISQINISGLPRGIYFLRTTGESVLGFKLIKE
jgi:hypothetical protein